MRYEDDALRFCTRDGSPLVNEKDFANTDSLDFSGALPERARNTEEISPIETHQKTEGIHEPDADETEIPRIVIRPRKTREEYDEPDGDDPHDESNGKPGVLKTVLITAIVTTFVLVGAGYLIWMYAAQVGISVFFPKNQLEVIAEPSPEVEPTPVPTPALPKPSPSPSPDASPSPSPTPNPSPNPSPKTRETKESPSTPVAKPVTSPESGDSRPRRVNR